MTTNTPTLEVWKNTGRGLFIMTKLNAEGAEYSEPIHGLSELRCTPEDRRLHESKCRPRLDPFKNGLLRPLNDAAVAAVDEIATFTGSNPWSNTFASRPAAHATPVPAVTNVVNTPDPEKEALLRRIAELEAQVTTPAPVDPSFQVVGENGELSDAPAAPRPTSAAAATPAALSEAEENDIVTGNGNRAKALLRQVDSSVVVERLLARAREEATPARVALLEKRLSELDEFARPVRSSTRVTDSGRTEAGPQDDIDLDALGDAQHAPIPGEDDLDPDTETYIPGEGVEPGTDDDSGPIITTPGGIPDGAPAPMVPPGLEVHPD